MENISLFRNKDECCGCNACASICPTGSIKMQYDDLGFLYPTINDSTCIKCGRCVKACDIKNVEKHNVPIKAFAGVSKESSIRLRSTSGGIFAVLAQEIIRSGGIVYGAIMKKNDGRYTVRHIGVSDISDLKKLQGSKYMQSTLEGVLPEIKEFLSTGKKVLFCGTPCQVAALKRYLGKEHSTLITIDILCHGVPSVKMFNDYIEYEKQKRKADGFSIDFRNKLKNHWTHGAVITIRKHNKSKQRTIFYNLSSFYMSFMDGHIMRDSCYKCKYASKFRPADITLGDYWGIKIEHPELLKCNGGQMDHEMGISCITANSQKGLELLQQCREQLVLFETQYEKIAKSNPSFERPTSKPIDRDEYITEYVKNGFEAIDNLYRIKYKRKIPIFKLKNSIPYNVKSKIRKLLGGSK